LARILKISEELLWRDLRKTVFTRNGSFLEKAMGMGSLPIFVEP